VFETPVLNSTLLVFLFISGFRRDVDEIYALLGYYAASSGNPLPTFRDNVPVPFSRVKKSKVTTRRCVISQRSSDLVFFFLLIFDFLVVANTNIYRITLKGIPLHLPLIGDQHVVCSRPNVFTFSPWINFDLKEVPQLKEEHRLGFRAQL
jgi:hypothetical protein